MAVIAITQRNPLVPYVLTKTTLTTGPDTLAFVQGANQVVGLENSSGSSVTVTILGASASSTYPVANAGGATINAAAGLAVVVAAGTTKRVALDGIANVYLQGAVTFTSSTAGVFCSVETN